MRWNRLTPRLALAGLLAIALCLPASAKSESAAPKVVEAHPAVWVVQDQDTTIYLFGTIHLLKPEIRWFDGPVRKAFDASQQLVVEVAESDEAGTPAKVMQRALQPEAPTISSRLPEGSGPRFLSALEDQGLSPIVFDRVKPWFAALTLSILPLRKLGYDPDSGADHVLKTVATQRGKIVTGFETADQQIGFFEDLPDPLQIEMLDQTLDELPKLGDMITQMIAAWSRGEPDRLAALLNDSINVNPELEKRLLTDRNARWTQWIDDRMDQPGTVFIAVGAGHLAGKNSVQTMLKQRGFTVRRVKRVD